MDRKKPKGGHEERKIKILGCTSWETSIKARHAIHKSILFLTIFLALYAHSQICVFEYTICQKTLSLHLTFWASFKTLHKHSGIIAFPSPLKSALSAPVLAQRTNTLYFHRNVHITLYFSHCAPPLLPDYKLHNGTLQLGFGSPSLTTMLTPFQLPKEHVTPRHPNHQPIIKSAKERQVWRSFTNPVQRDRLHTLNQGQSLWMLETPLAQKYQFISFKF